MRRTQIYIYFFTLFKHIIDSKQVPDVDRTLMLRSLLSERAQEANSTVSATDCLDYSKVKSAVFKAYEAQRRNFGKWEKVRNKST